MAVSAAALSAMPTAEASKDAIFLDVCVDCHGDSPKYPVRGAALEFESSGHKNLGNSHYANGEGCQQCHTSEGFVQFVQTGKVGDFVPVPSQPDCFTCHTPHTKGNFSLRTTEPVTLADGTEVDNGAGNLCASCHHARTDARKEVKPMAARDIRSYWGGHHGPQADVLNGANAFEFAGKKYSSSQHRDIIRDGCAICHMAYPQGRYSLSPQVGGHSFAIVGEVHEQPVANTFGCVSCHEGIAQVRGQEIFDITAKADYDLDGIIEPVQAEVAGIFDLFVNERGTGYLQRLTPPFYGADGSWYQSMSAKERPTSEVAALYNYKLFLEDRSKGVHNTIYTIQVLYDSLKALDPSFDDSRRPE